MSGRTRSQRVATRFAGPNSAVFRAVFWRILTNSASMTDQAKFRPKLLRNGNAISASRQLVSDGNSRHRILRVGQAFQPAIQFSEYLAGWKLGTQMKTTESVSAATTVCYPNSRPYLEKGTVNAPDEGMALRRDISRCPPRSLLQLRLA